MQYPNFTPEEVEARGEQLYETQIRGQVEAGNEGKFVVIDIETGEYFLDEDDVRASQRALARRSNAVLYGIRVGYPTAYTLGGHSELSER